MKQSSTRSSDGNAHAAQRRAALLTAVCCLLSAGLGCEGWQKKFVRRSKKAPERPSPIVNFQDYTRTMTPLDRYRKHALMFDYWNDELIEALGPGGSNEKRIKRASAEALQELTTLAGVLQPDYAAQLQPMVEARRRLNAQLQRGTYVPSQQDQLRRSVEMQTRKFERQFSWQDVQDHLNPLDGGAAAP